MEDIKEYTNGEITIVWNQSKCMHSGNCVKNNAQTFKPKERPWIQPENSNSETIMFAIDKCPSGALTYYKNIVE